MSPIIMIIGGVALLVVIVLFIPVFVKSNKVNLTAPSNEKPEWMRQMPPTETVTKTLADGEGITIFDYEHGEKLAAPFAEQIEDIFRTKLQTDPELLEYTIDLGTDTDNTLEIWINGKKYKSISDLPDERLKKAFRESVKQWNSRN